jgi:glycosyltransferase involved in cell wall biosynthesis
MRIVFAIDWFAERMGYASNFLPKAAAALGYDVHLITSDAQPYFNTPDYKKTYEAFIGPGIVPCGIKTLDGYTLYRLPHRFWGRRFHIPGLLAQIRALRPHVVQTFDVPCFTTHQMALAKPFLGYKLFLESHLHASVFPPTLGLRSLRRRIWWFRYAMTWGRLLSTFSEKCYPISPDAADIVVRFFGIRKDKVDVCSLGVDTGLFRPPCDDEARQERLRLRQQFGFSPTDIVCIYTGRFSEGKAPLHLARAIGQLVSRGEPFRGLFVGNGDPADIAAIEACPGCIAQSFVPVQSLPPFYWAADIAVWPKQESTSQLDAAACGLPIILSDQVHVLERVSGNGLTYRENDIDDLARQIHSLADPNVRQQMGEIGSRKMREHFSWEGIARKRIQDYEAAVYR